MFTFSGALREAQQKFNTKSTGISRQPRPSPWETHRDVDENLHKNSIQEPYIATP
jgi:hypothetical protein